MTAPATQLLGLTLENGWKVVEALPGPRYSGGTGGHFSAGYVVERNGQRAFLKALDYSAALQAADPAVELQRMTTAFNFEREILFRCRDENLSRIIRTLEDGKVNVNAASSVGIVQYLIFELADSDIRMHAVAGAAITNAW